MEQSGTFRNGVGNPDWSAEYYFFQIIQIIKLFTGSKIKFRIYFLWIFVNSFHWEYFFKDNNTYAYFFLNIFRSKQKTSHNQHKKVGRSRSHHPRISDSPTSNMVSTVPEGGLGSGNGSQIIMGLPVANFGEKPVLRKHRSFPYEMFNNEASYSSDDSLRN